MEKNKIVPMVSVVIPMYNCEKYINRCIDSLLQQTYECIEVLIVDDGSTDAGAEIVKRYIGNDSRIQYFYQKNAGPAIARNKAILHAKGKYILFVDADDYVSKNYIEDLVYAAEVNNSELVFTGFTMVHEDGRKDKVVIPSRYVGKVAEEWVYRISACCSRMYLKDFWFKHELQFYQEKDARAEDVPIALYSNVIAKNIACVQSAGYYYYQHQGSAMNNREQKVIFMFPYVAFENMYKRIKKEDVENSLIFYYIGILKFLALFDLVIYRKAPQNEKTRFAQYLHDLVGKEYKSMVDVWNRSRMKVKFPILHKIAIQLFVWKYKSIIER